MKRLIALSIIFAGLSGCASIWSLDPNVREQQHKLTQAKKLLERNKTENAKKTLSEITAKPAVEGVTDEALFRLALLNLEAGQQKFVTYKAEKDLDIILGKFRSSSWTPHAMTVKSLINDYEIVVLEKAELDKSVRNLKNSNAALANANASLTKENSDLRQDLEKLKKLDLELEMKKKR
ncbi:MAG: hypothetical protein AB9919_09990 [Geobacteraceae bacterium]